LFRAKRTQYRFRHSEEEMLEASKYGDEERAVGDPFEKMLA
jgi:hypothetical protein